MRKRRSYRARPVKEVNWEGVAGGNTSASVSVGLDVGKLEVLAALRWSDGCFERPWLVQNPEEIGELVDLLCTIAAERELVVALEPTGTYGDPLRQALSDAGLRVARVNGKAAHDYAEIFDGVPSQHDGKDAAVVAELAALGKSAAWRYEPLEEGEQEMAYHVDWMDAQRRQSAMWLGRLEALLSRHWPEATRWLGLSSVTLLEALHHYGGPGALAGSEDGPARLARWSGSQLSAEKIEGLIGSARSSVGVRQTSMDVVRMRQYAEEALSAHREVRKSMRRLEELSRDNEVIQGQARVVGVPTACVLWVHLGNPRQYHCGAAYRKAMGLNLVERSSGKYQGQLRISKRGSSQVRRWLYFAAIRQVSADPTRVWYLEKKSRDGQKGKRALTAVMRRLALALYEVGANGATFEAWRLFPTANRGGKVRHSKRSPIAMKHV